MTDYTAQRPSCGSFSAGGHHLDLTIFLPRFSAWAFRRRYYSTFIQWHSLHCDQCVTAQCIILYNRTQGLSQSYMLLKRNKIINVVW